MRTFGTGLKMGLLGSVIVLCLVLGYSVHSATKILVDTDSVQTLENKTIGSSNTISGVDFTSPEITGTVTGGATYSGVTLSTATINSGTIPSPTISGTVAGNATYTAPTINGGTIQGTISAGTGLTMPSFTVPTSKMITVVDAPSSGTDVANKDYVDGAVSGGGGLDGLSDVTISGAATGHVLRYGGSNWANYDISSIFLPLAGGTLTGDLTLNGAPSSSLHATTKTYVDTADALKVAKAGDTMTGALTLSGAPTAALHAATKAYVDGAIKIGIFHDQQTSGTNGGDCTSGSWATRILNTEVFDPDNLFSISSNQVVVPAGKWLIYATAPSFDAGGDQMRIYNGSDSTVVAYGSSAYSGSNTGYSTGFGYLSLSSSKNIRVEHRCGTAGAATKLGRPNSFGVNEVYTMMVLVKIGS